MNAYHPEFFQLCELVPADEFRVYPAHVLWSLFDSFILMAADALRRFYGKMLANTWYWGGGHQYRGWRPPGCTVGAPLSMHRFARAIDLEPLETSAAEIRADMRRYPKWAIFKYISRVEDDVAWLHIDRANVAGDGIVFFKG